jgi:hypothetical protein
MTTYQMSLISAGSISLDSTFKSKYCVYCVNTHVELLIVSYAEIITGWSIPANKTKTPFRILSSGEHHLLHGQI